MYILILTIMLGSVGSGNPAITSIGGFKTQKECQSAGEKYVNENSPVFSKSHQLEKTGVIAKFTCVHQSK